MMHIKLYCTHQLLFRQLFLLGSSLGFSAQLAAQRQVSENDRAVPTPAQVFPLDGCSPGARGKSLAQNPQDHRLHSGCCPQIQPRTRVDDTTA